MFFLLLTNRPKRNRRISVTEVEYEYHMPKIKTIDAQTDDITPSPGAGSTQYLQYPGLQSSLGCWT